MIPPAARLLPGGRLHLQHGPIDLIVEAVAGGFHASKNSDSVMLRRAAEQLVSKHAAKHSCVLRDAASPLLSMTPLRSNVPILQRKDAIARAYRAAIRRFATILSELCGELPVLRSPTRADALRGTIARRMEAATLPFADETFVTPMAAVAGAVAEAVLAAMTGAAELARASVNNGGDIALHLHPDETTRIGLVDRPDAPSLFGAATLAGRDGIGGIATSGWRGRSFSLGIADAVTILAVGAPEADAAATIVANAVDLPGHPAVTRRPAREVQHDSDLGERLVTRDVGALARSEIEAALAGGLRRAEELVARGLIRAAALHLRGVTVTTPWKGMAISGETGQEAA